MNYIDALYVLMLVSIYSVLIWMLFRLRAVLAAHDNQVTELSQTVAAIEHENTRLEEYEGQRQVEIDEINGEIIALKAKIEAIEQNISPDKIRGRMRVYLANERRTGADQEYLVHVRNERMAAPTRPKAFADSWAHGRIYVLWASSPEIAQSSAEARFPSSARYTVDRVERSPYGMGSRHG
jgi:hypothetical protein